MRTMTREREKQEVSEKETEGFVGKTNVGLTKLNLGATR